MNWSIDITLSQPDHSPSPNDLVFTQEYLPIIIEEEEHSIPYGGIFKMLGFAYAQPYANYQ